MTNKPTRPRPLLNVLWSIKGNIAWSILIWSVCAAVYKTKTVDKNNNFKFEYYFTVRYYSPFFWLYLILALLVAFFSGGYPEFRQCLSDNFSGNDEGDTYTLTGGFTEIHMKTFYPIRKFLDFVMIYGNA